jgi:hypothetical protein
LQYSCFGVDGLLKGAVYTASTIQEWDGPQGTFLSAGGMYRVRCHERWQTCRQ